jgi:hypothetical protein
MARLRSGAVCGRKCRTPCRFRSPRSGEMVRAVNARSVAPLQGRGSVACASMLAGTGVHGGGASPPSSRPRSGAACQGARRTGRPARPQPPCPPSASFPPARRKARAGARTLRERGGPRSAKRGPLRRPLTSKESRQ